MLLHFDFDGVFVDSFDQLLEIAGVAQDAIGCGRVPIAEDFRSIQNLTFSGLGEVLGLTKEQSNKFGLEMFRLNRNNYTAPSFFPGVVEVAKKLSKKHEMLILTSNIRSAVERQLKPTGLLGSFADILDAELPGSKGDKILKSMETRQTQPSDTFMIGDTLGDITEGKKAGVRTIAVTWGYQSEETLSEALPDYYARKPEDLLEIL